MKFLNLIFCLLSLFLATLIDISCARSYNFVPARCVEHQTDQPIGGPLKICTFPPKHAAVPQEEINAVIQHIQTLKLDH